MRWPHGTQNPGARHPLKRRPQGDDTLLWGHIAHFAILTYRLRMGDRGALHDMDRRNGHDCTVACDVVGQQLKKDILQCQAAYASVGVAFP